MTKNITIWIFSVLFLLITCVGINDFCHTMTYNEAYIGSHFGAGGLIYFKNYPLALAILFGITVFLPPISVVMVLLFRKNQRGNRCSVINSGRTYLLAVISRIIGLYPFISYRKVLEVKTIINYRHL